MADISTGEIEAYITEVIGENAGTVAEVAPVAAQAAVEFAGLTIHETLDPAVFMSGLLRMRRDATGAALIRILRGYQQQYADSTLTPSQVLQEIIEQNGG